MGIFVIARQYFQTAQSIPLTGSAVQKDLIVPYDHISRVLCSIFECRRVSHYGSHSRWKPVIHVW